MMAEVTLATAYGSMLEQAANPEAMGGSRVGELIGGLSIGEGFSGETGEGPSDRTTTSPAPAR
jgi:hypothetical protein